MNAEFCNSTLLAYLEFAQSYPERYRRFLNELGASEDWLFNKLAWHDGPFLQRFCTSFETLYCSDPEVLARIKSECAAPPELSPLAALTYKSYKDTSIPIFQAAITLLVSPKLILERLPSIIARISNYSSFEYTPGPQRLRSQSGTLVQTYKHKEREELNRILAETLYAGLLGLFHAFGIEDVSIHRTYSIQDDRSQCELQLRWNANTSRLAHFSALLALPLTGVVTLLWTDHISLETAALTAAAVSTLLVGVQSYRSKRKLLRAYETQERMLDDLHTAYANMAKANEELIHVQQSFQEILNLASLGEKSYSVVHDFATPVQAIVYAAKKLRAEDLHNPGASKKSQQYLTMVTTASSKLLQLQQLLRKSIMKEATSELESLQLDHLLAECLDVSSHLVCKYEIEVEVLGDKNLVIKSDRAQLVACLLNLIENAARALSGAQIPHPKITLSWKQVRGFVHLYVADNGPGIPPGVLAEIWKPFKKSEVHPDHEELSLPGTGFGLYRVKSTLAELGAEIDVKSSNKGTCFTVALPAALTETNPQMASHAS